ncbi:MAG TPA: protein translocase subunit SecF, partial [Solirubrobacteraceae bacterium]|nr:protein translocase subunit SecF [Solirubrobacteraceae bacterium]
PVLGDNVFQIQTRTLGPDRVKDAENVLNDKFGVARDGFDSNSVGPTFGEQVAKSAIRALILSMLVITAYVAFRFQPKFAIPVLIALLHDILITAGIYSLTGREVTTGTVAAFLTILGYSLYDTIIVFDRIRENVPRMPRATYSQIVNRSMSEVLTRSLATSFCTLLPILALYLFGGETLKDFAFALIVGTISGAYSSVFIASPVLTHWKEREPVYARRRQRMKAELGVVPAYATAVPGAGVDVEPERRRRAARRITAPETPERQVSRDEFDEMVRDLHATPAKSPTATAERDPGADLAPEDLVMKDDKPKRDKQRRPRNRKHGRSR